MLVAIQSKSGQIEVYERVDVRTEPSHYRYVPCEVIADASGRQWTWKVAAIAAGIWLAQFGAEKVAEVAFQLLLSIVAG